jgi:hypothetical protein
VAAAGAPPVGLEAVAPAPPQGAGTRRVLRRIARDQGADLAKPSAVWGYESVRVVLDAIRAAQGDGRRADRAGVVREALRARIRRSPIGAYEVHRNGAIEGVALGLYELRGDRFEFARALR